MNIRHASVALLVVLLGLSVAYLAWVLPNWRAALPPLTFVVALVLIARGRASGYSFGLAGLFVMFILAVAFVVGDYEEPTLSYVAMPRYAWLAIACGAFLSVAWVLKRAQNQCGSRGGF